VSCKQRPVLKGDWWLIGSRPAELKDLPEIDQNPDPRDIEMVDHHVFQDDDGKWHLWGCVRNTPVGRVLYHWDADSLTDSPWRCTKELIRIDRSYGECENDGVSEQIQSPFIVKHDGRFYMFYGGVNVKIEGVESKDSDSHLYASKFQCQMCLMISEDGKKWVRHKNSDGQSRVFCGPGATRDPSLIKIDDVWFCYYTGFHGGDTKNVGVYLRTSQNLIDWSDAKLVHYDEYFGHHFAMNECPAVVKHDDLYYLFVTESYYKKRTHVFCSADPYDFGVDDYTDNYDGNDYYAGRIKVAAPEIIVDGEGCEYITSNHNPPGGTMMTRLGWVDIS